jgi:hemolysin activation/secretion protein
LPPVPLPEEQGSPEDEAEIVPKLNGIVFVKTPEEIKTEGVPAMTGLDVRGIPILSGDDFKVVIYQYLGRPAKRKTITRLERDVILFCRAKNRPLVDVILPEQNVDNGVLQIWFLEGRVGKMPIENEGHKWFKDELIRRQVRLKPGDSVDSQRLLADLDWLNRNPFRDVRVLFKQGDEQGRTDVALQVKDRIPLRVYGGFENSGNKLTGVDRLLAGFNWGNVFGLDHQLNYQYTTDTDFRFLKAHSASYIVPLPWRHTISLLGSYVDARGDLVAPLSQSGRSYQASLRYGVPLPAIGKYQHEATVGFDFKRSDNSLEFNSTAFSKSDTDIDQIEVGYTGLLPDPWGQTSLGVELFYSPGGLTENNDDAHFNALRPGAPANYTYGRLNAERITRLPWEFSWILRGQAQTTSDPLMPSEQLGLGGYSTVRGYEERVVNGDKGWLVVNEVRTPGFRIGNLTRQDEGQDYLQLLAFFDYGAVRGESPHADLYSAGAGLRCNP